MDIYYPQSHQSSFKPDKCIKEKVFDRNFSKSQEYRPQPPQRFKNIKTFGKL